MALEVELFHLLVKSLVPLPAFEDELVVGPLSCLPFSLSSCLLISKLAAHVVHGVDPFQVGLLLHLPFLPHFLLILPDVALQLSQFFFFGLLALEILLLGCGQVLQI